ncbi:MULTISPECIES: hypothetical protein [Desulfosediminicola]|uniref:hypothetical protein n=1 Tax=Desulfosediminicola TaxID=2886823 RepID=UPI0010AD2FB5|nr:hypothetical protein [Desulfosediminicola ganghwensis]
MAPRRKPAGKKIKFELTPSGIAGVGIVCFCIFLWMFLFGVWTGQSLLLPAPKLGVNERHIARGEVEKNDPARHIQAEELKKIRTRQ